ncbi:MAG: Ig-like domain-containing protein, partial [Prolixibacteraceae bacterium]
MPTGGPIDSLPPVLINTSPDYKALNFDGNEVQLTFNEFIVTDQIRDKLVISPPLKERPVIRTKSKTLIVEFQEDLKDSTTYSLDFKNSVADNNEKNEYKNLRFSFSTGSVYDSLRIAGRVTDAFNLEPKKNVLVMLHENLHDSAVYSVTPNYIARTDDQGLFYMDNLAPNNYHLFSITDVNNDLRYNEGAEEIAFVDTVVTPRAEFTEQPDTLVTGADSLLISGHTRFYPEPFHLRQFTEDLFDQYLSSYKRLSRDQSVFVFNETVRDTFDIRLLNREYAVEWYLMEYNETMDSLAFWITDTLVSGYDTLLTELSYYQLDSLQRLYVHKDTVELIFTEPERKVRQEKKKKDEEDIPEPIEQFSFSTNIKTPFDLNRDVKIIAPAPLMTIDT